MSCKSFSCLKPCNRQINWEQAHFSFREYWYSATEDYKFLTTLSFTSLEELDPLLFSKIECAIPAGYDAITGNTNGNYDVVFIVPEGEEESWENCEIFYYNRETEESMQMLFASIFKYQDELRWIGAAQNKDERVAFVVETKEFNYDFYFDPAGLTTDIFLRPSSYRTIGGK